MAIIWPAYWGRWLRGFWDFEAAGADPSNAVVMVPLYRGGVVWASPRMAGRVMGVFGGVEVDNDAGLSGAGSVLDGGVIDGVAVANSGPRAQAGHV